LVSSSKLFDIETVGFTVRFPVYVFYLIARHVLAVFGELNTETVIRTFMQPGDKPSTTRRARSSIFASCATTAGWRYLSGSFNEHQAFSSYRSVILSAFSFFSLASRAWAANISSGVCLNIAVQTSHRSQGDH